MVAADVLWIDHSRTYRWQEAMKQISITLLSLYFLSVPQVAMAEALTCETPPSIQDRETITRAAHAPPYQEFPLLGHSTEGGTIRVYGLLTAPNHIDVLLYGETGQTRLAISKSGTRLELLTLEEIHYLSPLGAGEVKTAGRTQHAFYLCDGKPLSFPSMIEIADAFQRALELKALAEKYLEQ